MNQHDWRVENGAFIGKVLVSREGTNDRGMKVHEDDWLPFTHDLRSVTSMKVSGFEEDHQHTTSLYHNGAFIAEVNAEFSALVPHWIETRHLFDAQPITHEQAQAQVVV